MRPSERNCENCIFIDYKNGDCILEKAGGQFADLVRNCLTKYEPNIQSTDVIEQPLPCGGCMFQDKWGHCPFNKIADPIQHCPADNPPSDPMTNIGSFKYTIPHDRRSTHFRSR